MSEAQEQQSERWQSALTKARPRFTEIAKATGVTWAVESTFAHQIISRNNLLTKCDPASVRDAIVNVATVGLTLNPAHKYAYLVPRDGLCCLDISYRGMLKIATDSGSVRHAAVELVYSSDDFQWKGKHALPRHEFDPFASEEDRGKFRGAYLTARLADGDWLCDHMSADEIYKIRECSKSYKDRNGNVARNSPWAKWFDEMVKKTMIKRASKTWPQSDRLAQAADILNAHEGMEERFQNARDVTQEATQTISDEQAATIQALAEEVGDDLPQLLDILGVERVEDIPADRYTIVVRRLENLRAEEA